MIKFFLPLIIGIGSLVGLADLVHACVNNSTGAVRIVMENSTCGEGETLLEWQIAGPQGPAGPAGPQGPQGIEGPKGDPGNNADVTALTEQVTNLQEQVAASQGQVTALQAQVEALQAKLVHVTTVGNVITIAGANLQVVNGEGETDSTNGLGNVIIGYNEARDIAPLLTLQNRSGSHMLVVGPKHHFTSYGGIVVGEYNTTSGRFSSVLAGQANTAEAWGSSITGGQSNTAGGDFSTVGGGYDDSTTSGNSWRAGDLFTEN